MLEEFEDTEVKSPKRSCPEWADADTGVEATAKNGPGTSPFSPWQIKMERDNETELCIKELLQAYNYFFSVQRNSLQTFNCVVNIAAAKKQHSVTANTYNEHIIHSHLDCALFFCYSPKCLISI